MNNSKVVTKMASLAVSPTANAGKAKEISPPKAGKDAPVLVAMPAPKEKRRMSESAVKATTMAANVISAPPAKVNGTPKPVEKAAPPVKTSSTSKPPASPKLTSERIRNRSRSPRRDEEAMDPPQIILPPLRTISKSDTGLTLVSNHVGMQGKRPSMEDEHLSLDLSYQNFDHLGLSATPTRPLTLYAIFDGHTGNECAKFAGKLLPARLREKLTVYNRKGADLTVQHLLVFTMEDLDREFMETHPGSDAGCTAVVCLIDTVQKMCYCANIGDSRAIIGRKLNHLPLTRDQDGFNLNEAKRVKGSGGTIDDEGYINDTVNMTRSLGDRAGKFRSDVNGFFSRNFAIVSAPEVRIVPLTDTHMFLLLACDGLFEPGVFTSTQIIQRARQLLTEACPSLEDITSSLVKGVAKTLCKEAIERGSADNVSVMIVCFC